MGCLAIDRLLFWLLVLVFLSACSGLVVNASLIFNVGYRMWPLKDRYLDVWMSALLAYFALEGLLMLGTTSAQAKRRTSHVVADNGFFILMSIVFLELAASWDVYGRLDIGVWCIAIIAVSIVNVYAVSSRQHAANLGLGAAVHTGLALRSRRKRRRIFNPMTEQSSLIRDNESSDDDDDVNNLRTSESLRSSSEEAANATHRRRFSSSSSTSCVSAWCGRLHVALRVLVLAAVGLLMYGGVQHGAGIQAFPPDAGNNTSFRPILLEAGRTHSIADWHPIVRMLSAGDSALRVCVWDKPGLGYSDYAFADQLRTEAFYADLLLALSKAEPNFTAPFALVGVGEAADPVLQLAASRPELVASVLLVEAKSADQEWRILAELSNWTRPQLEQAMASASEAHLPMAHVMKALGVPFGMAKHFASPRNASADVWTKEEAAELQWLYGTEKRWVIHKWSLQEHVVNASSALESGVVRVAPGNGIPVHVLSSNLNREQMQRMVCASPPGVASALTYADLPCDLKLRVFERVHQERLSAVANSGSVSYCDADERCAATDYFLLENPEYTAQMIAHILLNATI